MKKIILILAALTVGLFISSGASAKRNSAYVNVSPSAPLVGDNLVFSGCGYSDSSVTIVVVSPYATSWTGASVDGSGCFSSSSWGYTALESGNYEVKIYQSSDHHNPSALKDFVVN